MAVLSGWSIHNDLQITQQCSLRSHMWSNTSKRVINRLTSILTCSTSVAWNYLQSADELLSGGSDDALQSAVWTRELWESTCSPQKTWSCHLHVGDSSLSGCLLVSTIRLEVCVGVKMVPCASLLLNQALKLDHRMISRHGSADFSLLHLVNDVEHVERRQPGYDRRFKVYPIMDFFQWSMVNVRNFEPDEMTIAFQGRSTLKVDDLK